MEPEVELTARSNDKGVTAKKVATEDGAETRVGVEAKAAVRYRYVGILTEILNKV